MSSHPTNACCRPLRGVLVRLVACCGTGLFCTPVPAAEAAGERQEFFETYVRPVLANHCVECHGEQDQSGGLRLDSRAAVLRGGDGGPVVDLERPAASRLLAAVRREGDLEMPPDDPLSRVQIEALQRWIEQGAVWPESRGSIRDARAVAAEEHWAFQPVIRPEVPATNSSWVRTPVDAFILVRLKSAGLSPSPEADRRTLIRRATYTLTGLPPTPEDVEQFVHDPDPLAYDALIERLLDSPAYGEHWARHWLDVARYSDTKGYVYAREERFWIHAWVYRDWIVRALNDNMPYNRLVRLQIAADQVADARREDLAAMGFLTLGRRFLGVERDIIDDRIDVVTRGTMGLTVGCARCHDHKYDPIPTADYYSLYGVFDSCREEIVRLADKTADDAFEAELAKRQAALEEALAAARAEWSERVRSRVADYLTAQTELEKYPPKGFDQIFEKTDMLPEFVRRWENYLREAARRSDPVWVPWHLYAVLPPEGFAEQAKRVTAQIHSQAEAVNPLVLQTFADPPQSFAEVIDRYASLLTEIDEQWKQAVASAAEGNVDPPTGLDDPAAEQLRGVLYGPEAPCEVPHEPIVQIESYVDSATCTNLWKLQGEVDRWIIQAGRQAPHSVTLVDRPVPTEPRVFRRGNPATKGEEVPRRFLSVLTEGESRPFSTGSGRSELAEAIVNPGNPLTARVMVNRVWMHHFGTGLVATPSDFGTRAGQPSHPRLLDWLADNFVASGWDLKQLHRTLLLSATFRQSSIGPDGAEVLARAEGIDPENRLLWRMTPRRLAFEELRDSLLAVGGALDRSVGGKPANLFAQPWPQRRTLYGLVDRQFFPNTLRVFDFANPDLHIPERPETTVPQQALFVMNHPFVLQQVRRLVERTADATGSDAGRVSTLFRYAFQREPTEEQRAAALEFLATAPPDESPREPQTAADWQYGYGAYGETEQRVPQFTPLPHFTGSAWQGGANWPDAALGWVQLTATGGHPGNDRAHAAIRRWTAPREMTIEIDSRLVHEAKPGDGIRAFIVSSRSGLIDSVTVHQQTHEFHSESLSVEPGETIDFVVDIGEVLNSDQYLWSVKISDTAGSGPATQWSSERDFTQSTVETLTPLEQLAHVLVSSNEFLFVD